MIIVDTSFILSYLNVSDPLHFQAIYDMARVQKAQDLMQINSLVLQEILTLHNLKFKQKSFLHHFCSSVYEGHSTTTIFKHIKNSDYNKIQELIILEEAKHLSFTDMSLIVDLKQYKSGQLLTYDESLSKYAEINKLELFSQKAKFKKLQF